MAAAALQISLFAHISQYWLGCDNNNEKPRTQWLRGAKHYISLTSPAHLRSAGDRMKSSPHLECLKVASALRVGVSYTGNYMLWLRSNMSFLLANHW